MKEVSIFDIVETADDRCMVVLLDDEFDPFVAIGIGAGEGHALISGLRDIPVMRPLSHDLMAQIVDDLGGALREVRIERLVAVRSTPSSTSRRGTQCVKSPVAPATPCASPRACSAPIYVDSDLLSKLEHRNGGTITLRRGDEALQIDGTSIDVLAARILEQAGGPL